MELNYESEMIYFVDEDNLCQNRFRRGDYFSDNELFELFTKE
jgi:hypothetical protein